MNTCSRVLFAGVLLFALHHVDAATHTVTNVNDTGTGSLRAAIAAAAVDDTINFSLPSHSVITLTSGGLDVSALTVKGPGAGLLTITRDAASADFTIFVTGGQTTISGLTITNGHADANALGGGGIFTPAR
jgi:hypothetical protein